MRGTHGFRRVLMAATMLLWIGALASAKVIKDSDLPEGWSKVLDQKSGKFYYWNSANNEVQWHRPFELELDELDDVDDLVRGTGIESHDYKILEASDSKDVDDFFEGTEELANNIQLVGTEKREEKEEVEEKEKAKAKAKSKKASAAKAEKQEPGMCTGVSKESGTCGDDKQSDGAGGQKRSSTGGTHRTKGTGRAKDTGSKDKPPGPPAAVDSYEHFAKHDKDGDGVLSEKEFIRALRSTYLDPHRLSVEDAASVKDFFASSQGTVSFPQWQSLFVNDEEDEGEEEEEEESGARGRSRGTGGSGGAGGAKEEGWSGARGGEGRSGGGEQFQEGDLVRIVGFDGGDALSVHNGEVANVVNVKGQNLVVKTAVGAKVLEVGYDKVMHARQFRTRDGDEPAEEMTEEKAMRQYFDRYDADGDGKLDRSELRAMFAKKDGAYVADQAVEEMLADLDEDESDSIDPAEFWREKEGAVDMKLS